MGLISQKVPLADSQMVKLWQTLSVLLFLFLSLFDGQLLGFREFIPPYTTATKKQISTRVNYGSGSGDRISLDRQLLHHIKTISRLSSIQRKALKKCIYMINIGSNDYINNYLLYDIYNTCQKYTIDQYADVLIYILKEEPHIMIWHPPRVGFIARNFVKHNLQRKRYTCDCVFKDYFVTHNGVINQRHKKTPFGDTNAQHRPRSQAAVASAALNPTAVPPSRPLGCKHAAAAAYFLLTATDAQLVQECCSLEKLVEPNSTPPPLHSTVCETPA
ncbi:hypothetical protein OSB04_un000797 [Centaurea solstitialis]|uniref:Uncharacterized protein n=1 Tax=Centaurea solstitialis TaxID=347529 RepID=A0AA38SMX6_9ASTR|nr:hypothetical protein OSB04_un000797 [Centaurea solstitialis]